jgi:hypothetical protein
LAGMTNGLGAASTLAWCLADVGLYIDDQNTGAAPPWEMPDYATELAACRRYWTLQWVSIGASAVGNANVGFALPEIMRVVPTTALSGAGTVAGGTGINVSMNSAQSGYFSCAFSGANQYVIDRSYAFSARM